jgi:5-methylcytosine-specific restriction endonuclease McrA
MKKKTKKSMIYTNSINSTLGFRRWLINQLRRISYKWPPRYTAFKKARVDKNAYKCQFCGKVFTSKEMKKDHIIPVIDPKKGFVDWNEFIKRLFCKESNFQILCKNCHNEKSREENIIRGDRK